MASWRSVPVRGGQTPGRERAAAGQAGPGRGGDRRPGKSARALGRDLQGRGLRAVVDAIIDKAVDQLTPVVGRKAAVKRSVDLGPAITGDVATTVRSADAQAIPPEADQRRAETVVGTSTRSVLRQGPARCGPRCSTRGLPRLGVHHVPPAVGTGPGAGTPGAGPAPGHGEPELVASAPSSLELGHHQAGRPLQVELVPALHHHDVYSRYAWGAGGPSGVGHPGRAAHRRCHLPPRGAHGQLTLHADRGRP